VYLIKIALKKDPGIPNLFPFKEKLMQQAAEAKQQARFRSKKNYFSKNYFSSFFY
jgi:hypothetical protein